MRRDSFRYETWLIHAWDRTHSYMRHDSFTYETWLIHIRDMTHSYMRHDSFKWDADESCLMCECVISYIWMGHASQVSSIWDADECDMTHFIWDAHQRDPPHRASGFAKTRTGGQRYIGCLLSDSPSCLSMFLSKFASGSIQSPNQMLCWGISVLASHSEIPNFENKLIKFPARIQLGYTRELGYTPTVHIYSKWNIKPWLNV